MIGTWLSIKSSLVEVLLTIWGVISDVEWNVPILIFMLLLGGLTSLLSNSGATERFSIWALSRVQKTGCSTICYCFYRNRYFSCSDSLSAY